MFNTTFWKDATERALKSAGQFGLGALGAVVFTSVDQVVNGGALVGLAIVYGAAASYLTSIGSANIGEKGTPSLVKTSE